MSIVFSTIIDNVKSFFAQEDALSTKPKQLPEAASEVFEKPSSLQAPTPARIVEKPLPTVSPHLPFSPEELRAALTPKQQTEQPKPAPAPEHRDISHEIVAFETALQDAHRNVASKEVSTTPRPAKPVDITPFRSQATLPESYFDEFSQFLTREDLAVEGLVGQDILWRMKEFHRLRQEGKQYYVHSKDMQSAIQRKIGDLKGLERTWFDYREQADQLENELRLIEHDIEQRASEVKDLLLQAKSKSRLEQTVEPGKEFRLRSGQLLRSLLDLKTALRTMNSEEFGHYVTASRNDFASWIYGAFGNEQLAGAIERLKGKQEMEIFLSKLSE